MSAKISAGLVLVLAVVLVGCGSADKPAAPPADTPGVSKGHTHGGWWCDEHGIPEEECSLCSDTVYNECKAKGDICPKHPDRAKSQCFVCDPSRKEKFAAKYRAKYGKEPPEPEGQTDGKE